MDHWFQKTDNGTANEAFSSFYKSYFYEIALFYYNVVVDLSWTMTYVSIEFACTQKGIRVAKCL